MGRSLVAPTAPPRTTAPSHWPSTTEYLPEPVPSPRLPPTLRAIYCGPAPIPAPRPPFLQLKLIQLSTHPAKGQFGLFNGGKKLPPGSWIRDYIGVVHTEEESDPDSDYDLALDPGKAGCDASKRGNESRMLNDYRGILERPNAKFDLRTFPLQSGKGEGIRMAIFAGPAGVEKNAEVCVNYGKGFWENRRAASATTGGLEGENENGNEHAVHVEGD